jgi:hypothetical protein
MRTHSFLRVFTVLAVFTLSFFSFTLIAQAEGFANVGTTLTIDPPESVTVGNPANVVAHLISSKGLPIANQPVELFVDGKAERREKTDASGTVTIRVRRDEAGTYALFATYKGSKWPSLGSSKGNAELNIIPAIVEINTTPSLPNVKFSLDNRIFSSDAYGVARIEVSAARVYHLKILPLENMGPNIQMEFSRWGDDIFQPTREVKVPLDKPLQAGFEVSYPVSQTFVDLSNQSVNFSRITSVTLKGSNGTTYTFEDDNPHWLPAGRVIRLNNGLQETKILYSIISVVIDGSNVVSQAQQRYYVHPNDVWPIKLLLYSARFTAHDALFGFPVGTGVHVEYPDSDVQTFTFNSKNEHQSDGLARGIYRVTVLGAKGYAPPTPIALSRNQNVELMVFSYLDMGVLAVIGLFLSLGLLLFGRPYIVRYTVALPSRAISGMRKFRPALLKELHNKIIALWSRIVFKKGHIRLENSNSAHDAATEVESTYPAIFEPTQYDQDIAQAEAPGAVLDHSQDNSSGMSQGEVPSPVEPAEIESSSGELPPAENVDTPQSNDDLSTFPSENVDRSEKETNLVPRRPRRKRHKNRVESLA